jgi:hypothetical protein
MNLQIKIIQRRTLFALSFLACFVPSFPFVSISVLPVGPMMILPAIRHALETLEDEKRNNNKKRFVRWKIRKWANFWIIYVGIFFSTIKVFVTFENFLKSIFETKYPFSF